ncbi:MAG: ribonuclease HII [bacterium]|nr:ribonuclease HII [bacterium]
MKYIVGIDEAGRGPLAGPVAIGIVTVPKNIEHRVFNIFRELNREKRKSKTNLSIHRGRIRWVKDSKQLNEKKREEIFEKIKKETKAGKLKYAVGFGSVELIDKEGITRAIAYAIARVIRKFKTKPSQMKVLLDGSLKAPKKFKNQKTIIKGDEKEMIIALASICAKVLRDRLMKRLAKKYPKYGFEIHKGYGTKAHIRAIKKYGLSKIHRKSFCKKFV